MKNQVDNKNHIATVGYVDDAVERLARRIKEGFDDTVTKAEFRAGLDGLEGRLGARMDRFETRMDQFETRMGQFETRMDRFEKKLDSIEEKMVTKSNIAQVINEALDARERFK